MRLAVRHILQRHRRVAGPDVVVKGGTTPVGGEGGKGSASVHLDELIKARKELRLDYVRGGKVRLK